MPFENAVATAHAEPHQAVGVDGELSLAHAIEPEIESNGGYD
jgi:hypothetical protein